jgi:hypothetical protein
MQSMPAQARPALKETELSVASQRCPACTWLGWFALVVLVHVSPVYADVAEPGWRFVPVHVRVTNLDEHPEFVLLLADGDEWQQVPDSGLPVYESSGGTYCALRRAEFAPEEIGPGGYAEQDYFENHPHLIRSRTEIETYGYVRTGDPTVGLDRVFRITKLTDETLSLKHTMDVVFLRDGRKVEKPVTGKERQRPHIRDMGRRIRIENMADHPDYTFVMRFHEGYTIMKPGRNVLFGRVYAVKKAGFDPAEIPVSYAEAWNYYVENRKLMGVPLHLSITPQENGRSWIAGITDVFAIDGISSSEVRFHPVSVEYTDTTGRVSQIPAADAAYRSLPEPLGWIPDSSLSKRFTDWALYARVENLDAFPDLVFLRGWPRSRQVLTPHDTFEFEPDTVCVVRKSEFAAWRLDTREQRAAFLQAVEAGPVEFDMSRCPFGLSHEARKVCNFRLEKDSSGQVRGKLVRVISVKTDGSRELFDIQDGVRISSHVVRNTHMIPCARKLPGWFRWLWFAGVPLLALAGIALVLLRRKSRPSGT